MFTSRISKIIVLSFFIFFSLIAGSFIIKIYRYQNHYIEQISKFLGVHLEINGETNVKFFNLEINAKNVFYKDPISESVYSAKNMLISFAKLPFLYGTPKIARITFNNGEANIKNLQNLPFKEGVEIHLENFLIKVPSILVESYIKTANYNIKKNKLSFEGVILNSTNKEYKFSTSLENKSKQFNLYLHSSEGDLSILSSPSKFGITGKGTDLNGFLSSFNIMNPNPINTDKTKSNNFTISTSNDGRQIYVDSDIAKFASSITSSNVKKSIQVKAKYIDLSHFNYANIYSVLRLLIDAATGENKKIDLSFETDLIQINEHKIKNVSLLLEENSNNRIILKKISAELNDSKLIAGGTIDLVKNYLPIGEFFLNWNGNTVKSALDLMPESILQNALIANIDSAEPFDLNTKMKIADGMFILSGATLDIGKMQLHFDLWFNSILKQLKGDLEIASLQFNKIPYSAKVKDLYKYLDGYDASFKVHLTDLEYQGKKIDNIEFIHNVVNKKYIESLNIASDDITLQGTLFFDKNNKRIISSIEGDKFNLNFIRFPKILEVVSDADALQQIEWSKKKFINFDDGIEYNVTVKMKELFNEKNAIPFKNFELFVTVKNGVLVVEKCQIKQDDLIAALVMTLDTSKREQSLNGEIRVNNLVMDNFLKDELKIDYVKGKISTINAMFTSRGNNVSDIIARLKGKLEFSSDVVSVEGANLDFLPISIVNIKSSQELDEITRIKFFRGKSLLYNIKGSSNIGRGIIATSFTFNTDSTSGTLVSNFGLSKMENSSVARIFFNNNSQKIIDLNINIEGSIWKPRIFFSNREILKTLGLKNTN